MCVQQLVYSITKRLHSIATNDDISEMKLELQLPTQTFTYRSIRDKDGIDGEKRKKK